MYNNILPKIKQCRSVLEMHEVNRVYFIAESENDTPISYARRIVLDTSETAAGVSSSKCCYPIHESRNMKQVITAFWICLYAAKIVNINCNKHNLLYESVLIKTSSSKKILNPPYDGPSPISKSLVYQYALVIRHTRVMKCLCKI